MDVQVLEKTDSAAPLVEYEHSNFAWGHSHMGLVVYADGAVYRYEYPHGTSDTD